MRKLLFATLASPAALFCPGIAAAQTTVSSSTTAPIATATAANGSPSDVTIASGVTVSPAGGAAVTLNSNNSVTNNGTLTFTDQSNAAGIAASAGYAGTIANAGTITVTETTTATDTDSDGDVDGALANGTNRYGINVTETGSFTGSVTNSGTITVVGNNSAGIAIAPQLVGSITDSGAITVTGSNAYGLHTGAVTGDVTVSAAITATGENATGLAIDGNVGGAVSIASAITATGFRGGATVYTAPDADDLLVGGSAVRIGGSVTGGISLTSAGSLLSYGSAPALQIGSSTAATTIGLVSGSTSGLVLAGTVSGSGINTGFSATGIQIGGLGQAVTITGGITNSGTVSATGVTAPATALLIGAGTTSPALTNSGTISAIGGIGAYAGTAVLVAAGASLPSLTNSGTISATSNGSTGTTAAIRDLSGTLTTIANSGAITASLTTGYTASQATAIDLSANTTGVSISNVAASTLASITGTVLTGSGADTLTVPVGTVTGNVSLGAGNDTVALSGTGIIAGAIDFGSGVGTLTVAGTSHLTGDLTFGAGSFMTLSGSGAFAGSIVQNGNPLALTVTSGTFGATNTGTIALSSLTVGASGVLQLNVDPAAGTSTLYAVTGAASLASGASFKLNLADFLAGTQTYTILTAGSLTAGTLAVTATSLPYLYSATATTSANSVSLTLAPKTAAQLGLNRSGTTAYAALFQEAIVDSKVQAAFLDVTDATGFQRLYSELLPDHSGALFLSGSDVSRGVAELAGDPATPRAHGGSIALWAGQLGGYMAKGQGDTEAYHRSFFGLAGGAELSLGALGAVGAQVDWSYHDVSNPLNQNRVSANLTELGGYWRASLAGLRLYARGAYGWAQMDSRRLLLDPSTSADSTIYTATADWSGRTTAINGGAAYELGIGRFILRPNGGADYFRLVEDGHAETGGGAGFDLTIGGRTSQAWTAHYALALGYKLAVSDERTTRVELEVGERKRLSGAAASTVASFADGQSFTLAPDAVRYGPEGKLRLAIGTDAFSAIGQVMAQKTEGEVEAAFSAGVRMRL